MAEGTHSKRRGDFWGDCLLLVAVAALLRFWGLTDLGLTHFDEGSYTLAGRWIASLGAEGNPPEPVHAPPLYPMLVGLGFWIVSVRDWVAISVSALAGALSIIPVYFLGRRWFDRRTGVLAALLWLTCAYSWFYSRMALTDSLFCLLFWTALWRIDLALERGGVRHCLIAGLAVGLCWNTKYNGFFVLLIAALWLVVEAFDKRDPTSLAMAARGSSSSSILSGWRRLGGASAVALFCILPWILLLAWTGKIPEVVESLWTHSFGSLDTARRFSFSAMISYLILWTSPALLLVALADLLVALLASFKSHRRLLIVTVIWVMASLAYRSFPRLLLPLVPALCLLAAAAIQQFAMRLNARLALGWTGIAMAILLSWNLFNLWPYLSLRTDSYRQAAAYVEGLEAPVLSQCSLNYYFYEREPSRELRRMSLEQLDEAVGSAPRLVMVIDPILNRFPAKRAWFVGQRAQMNPLGRIPIVFYPPVRYQGFNIEDEPNVGVTEAPFSFVEPVIEVWEITQ